MATNITVPALGESVVEATIARWLKQEGDAVKAGEAVVELETDKVDLEVPAEKDGILSKIERQAGEDVQIGDVLGLIEEGAAGASPAKADSKPAAATPAPAKEEAPAKEAQPAKEERATPVAKRVAAEQGVDLGAVSGAGPGGRVTKQDVENFVRTQQPPAAPAAAPKAAPATTAPAADPRGETRQRMTRRRRTIAERLVQAQQTAAMLTTFNEIDMSAVMDLRKRRNEGFEKRHGIKIGFMSFFTKAVIGALKAFPPVNAEIQGEDIVLKHYYDIGIAVGAEEGLVVPVLRNADKLSFADIERAIKEFAQKVQKGTLSIDDLRGGTFTITNGGVFGSLLSTPILNPPQVAILGMHKIQERPIALNGQVVIRPMMYVALSYDHRMVDGREAVQFLVKVKELIEDPEALLLEG
ncbi:MAG: 2-oxoglutarate dehydrogenase complex dihydrolipoyllysine-residue succinyltransferase [Caldilineaceae bacterium]|nr:2-oxoglutarate dehydrogenase complex dihydrolipoyllysine-residue succinyltransferase [Caldilineaceae bacterium]